MERPEFINPYLSLEILDAGKRADAFLVGEDTVIKIIKTSKPYGGINDLIKVLTTQYALLKEYMSPYVLDTNFAIGSTTEKDAAVVIFQEKVSGISFETAIRGGIEEGKDMKFIKDFLKKSLNMYRETGFIPDMFNSMLHTYSPIYTKNVIVQETEEGLEPILIDTNFSRKSERGLGPVIHNRLLARGIGNLLKKI